MLFDALTEKEKIVSLAFSNGEHRGPGKVVQNLSAGLNKIGLSPQNITLPRATNYVGILQYQNHDFMVTYKNLDKHVLIGPNYFVLPNENPWLCHTFNNFVVPSNWVKELYSRFPEMKDNNIFVWPVGIDTDAWQPTQTKQNNDDIKCFIYHKNRSARDLAVVEAICKKFKVNYRILSYGNYKETDLYNLCKAVKSNNGFAILLTGTESQGIAYMEILSMDVPCYVFNNPLWKSEDGTITAEATSVPYWDEKCGEITNKVDLEHFENFIHSLEQYKPRNYILENHTLDKSALAYYNLLRKIAGDELISL